MPRKKATTEATEKKNMEPVVLGEETKVINGKEQTVKRLMLPPIKQNSIMVKVRGTAPVILNAMTKEAETSLKVSQTTEQPTTKRNTVKKTKKPINKWRRLIESVHLMDTNKPYIHRYTDEGVPFDREYEEQDWDALIEDIQNGRNAICYDASGIKKGLMEAVIRVMGETKSTIHNANIQVIPQIANYIPISFGKISIDDSIIHNFNGTFVTFRNVLDDWEMEFEIRYNPDNVSGTEVLELVQAMGTSGGIGAHRIGLKGGTNGSFELIEACGIEYKEVAEAA